MFLNGLLANPDAPARLVNRRNGRILADPVTTAFDSRSRNKGLLGRDSLPAGSALIIAPCSAIHTWFMRFDIDVAFVAKDGRIIKSKNTLRPWRMAAAFRAFATIELPAGALQSCDAHVGDLLAIEFD